MIDQELVMPVCHFTCGNFANEAESAAELDRRLLECDLFVVYAEVDGYYLQPRLDAALQRPRIDRLLIPKPKLLDAGFDYGAIGVEVKTSGKKIGPVVSQCFDYSRAAFECPKNHVSVVPSWIFIWPLEMPTGDMASVMDQNRIGGLLGHDRCLLRFKTGNANLLDVGNRDTFRVGNLRQGGRAGSR